MLQCSRVGLRLSSGMRGMFPRVGRNIISIQTTLDFLANVLQTLYGHIFSIRLEEE